jgi:hypothetical protein
MTDDELAMAYADGELDPIAAKRFEKRMTDAPGLAAAVAAHRMLRARLQGGFAPIAEAPLPGRLTALLQSNVTELRPKAPVARYWRAASAMAACVVAALAIGHFWQPAPTSADQLMASGSLANSLEQQLAGAQGSTRILVSFRDRQGSYCRVFEAPAASGIACREKGGWALRRSQPSTSAGAGEYRQAASADAGLLAAAQEMMAGDPLTSAGERSAKASGWRD